MSHIDIFFDMDNQAFEGDKWRGEASRILLELSKRVAMGQEECKIMDINGNSVGNYYAVLNTEANNEG
jgi:hypothetical protein